MRIYVLGATGHIGTHLVPGWSGRVTRSSRRAGARASPYHPDDGLGQVERVVLDREATDADGTTAEQVLASGRTPWSTWCASRPRPAAQLVEGLRGRVGLHAHCGSIWSHGLSTSLPMLEDDPKRPFGEYGVAKHAIEQLLFAETESGGLASTVVHPGHISGAGWPVINPVGNLDPRVWTTIARGEELVVPGDASATMHHVHADDVAQVFERRWTCPRPRWASPSTRSARGR